MVKQTELRINNFCAIRINMELNKFIEKINNEWWTYAEEVVENNLADEIVLVGCEDRVFCPFFKKLVVNEPIRVSSNYCNII